MPRLLSKLRFWSNKSCQACKGHPTPPPCYNCVLKLETPPPDFTSLHGQDHFFSEDDQWSLYPFTEEYTYPEDAQMGLEDFHEGNEELCQGRASPFGEGSFHRQTDETSDFREYELPGPLSNASLAFLPDDRRHQALLEVPMPQRIRHPSAPVFSSNVSHLGIARTVSTSRLEYLDTSVYEDDRETMTSSSRSLLAALAVPIAQMEDQLSVPEPLSPRNRSPLPSQLLIPE